MNKKAFSLIEVLISVSIIIILAIVATSTSNNLKNNSNNSKVISDLNTIENALVAYKTEKSSLPKPNGNTNNFQIDWKYNHSFEDENTFGIYWMFTENTLEKRFLDITPLDPRTNQYYSYGITKINNEFELAWVVWESENYIAKLVWNYNPNWNIHSLIREYNGPNFITEKWNNLPYNPEDRLLVVTSQYWDIYKSWDTISNETWADLEIYFSDWSVSILSPWTVLTLSDLDFKKSNNLISKVNLFLQAWSIWTKATKLDNESSFDIYTSDMTASVRWTVFKVEITTEWRTEITVLEWKVEVFSWNENTGKTPIDTIEVIELPTWDLENPKKIDSVSNTVAPITWLPEPIQVWFTNPPIIYTLEETIIDEKDIKIEISEKHEPKNCYLESIEVKNNDYIQAYKEKNSNNCEASINKINRQCINWVLNWNNDYKYSSCSEPNKCPTTYDWQYVWVNQVWDFKTINRQENITWWTKEITRSLTCDTDLQYDHIDTPWNVTCDTTNWFIADNINWTCNCSIWASLQLVWWVNKCIASCSSFEIDWTCQDSENNLWWAWNIVWHAPLNWNVKLYHSSWYINWTDYYLASCEVSWSTPTWTWIWCNIMWKTWIYVDNLNTHINPDWLKFNNFRTALWINDNYAIEFNILFPSIRPSYTQYIFSDWHLNAFIDYSWKLILKKDWTWVFFTNISSLYDWNFHKILIKKEWTNFSVYIDDFTTSLANWTTTHWHNYLYIWSDKTYNNQINTIIDYIKFYKK